MLPYVPGTRYVDRPVYVLTDLFIAAAVLYIPANWDGRAARTNRNSITRPPENKFNYLLCCIEQFDGPAGAGGM